jgi:hypothetical protein
MGEVFAGDPRYVAGYQGLYHFLFLKLIYFEFHNLTLNVKVL